MKQIGLIILVVCLAPALPGCALPLAHGPIVAMETGVIEQDQAAYTGLEVNHHVDGLTYSLIARDGRRVSPETPEDEVSVLIRDRRIERTIELLGDEGIPRGRRVISAW